MRKVFCLVVLLPFATLRSDATEVPAATGTPSQSSATPPDAVKVPAVPPEISYVNGQLVIHAVDSTLGDVLAKVAAVTGLKIDAPEGASGKVMPRVQLGPGTAREVVASLLSGADFDYLIQASDTDPDKLQSVLIMPRNKASDSTDTDAPSPSSHSPFVRVPRPVEAEEAPVAADSSVPAQVETAAAAPSPSNPTPSTPTTAPAEIPSPQRDPSSLTKPGTLTPPQTLDAQSISQQLQQMYQQRMQMIQQNRQPIASPAAQQSIQQ